MTAEEYLNDHCNPEDWNNLEERLKDSILTNNVIEHMERYAALRINGVLDRRKELVTFLKWVGDGYNFENNAEKIVKEYIDEGN